MKETLIRGSIGTAVSTGAAVVSVLPAVEQWLRIASLVVGIAVGVATLVTVLQKRRENKPAAEPPVASGK